MKIIPLHPKQDGRQEALENAFSLLRQEMEEELQELPSTKRSTEEALGLISAAVFRLNMAHCQNNTWAVYREIYTIAKLSLGLYSTFQFQKFAA